MLMIWYFQQIDTKTRMVMWSLPGWAQCHYNVLQGSGQNTRTMRKHQALQLMQRCQTLWLHLQWNISVVATRFCKALGIPKEYKIPSIVSLPFLLAANCCSKQLESLQEHSSVESLAVSSIWVQLFLLRHIEAATRDTNRENLAAASWVTQRLSAALYIIVRFSTEPWQTAVSQTFIMRSIIFYVAIAAFDFDYD